MSKKIAVGMLAACALAGIGARGEELNVAEGETVTLSESMSVDRGTVAGKLILSDGMTLTLARNVFDAAVRLFHLRGCRKHGYQSLGHDSVGHPLGTCCLAHALRVPDGANDGVFLHAWRR